MGLGTWANQAAFDADVAGVKANAARLLSVLATEQLLTIDIYTDATPKTFVRIGIPTFEIKMDDLTLNVGLWTDNAGVPGTFQSLGQVYIGGIDVLLDKNNYVDISQNDTAQGVLIHVGNKGGATPASNPAKDLMHLTFTAASWGDEDGIIVGSTGAGFVGITGMTLAIGMDMTMNINVGTTYGHGVPGLLSTINSLPNLSALESFHQGLLAQLQYNDAATKDDVAYILNLMGTIGKTSVDIALAGSITVSRLATQVVLAGSKDLTLTPGVLGNIYVSGVKLDILGNAMTQNTSTAAIPQSWVSISAH
jgi:hypothetical protein